MNSPHLVPVVFRHLGLCRPSRRGVARGVLAAAMAFLAPAGARATTANNLCAPTADPCRVNSTVNVTPGSVIDVGARRLLITSRGALNLSSGMMTLRAAELTVDPNGGSLSANGSLSTPGGKIVVIADRITINGGIDATGAPGGTVTLTSTGPLTLAGVLDVHSRATDAGGGSAELQGTDVTVTSTGRINALGGPQDFGGTIDFRATGTLLVGGNLTATGGDGGDVDLSASGALTINSSVVIAADASAAGGSGGGITASAVGNLVIDGNLSAIGRNGSDETGGGDGGTITLDGSTINATRTMSMMDVSAGGPDGVAGDIDVTTSLGDVDLRSHIQAGSTGVDGTGGTISIDAAGAAAISGDIDGSGGGDSGGDIEITSGSVLTVNMAASLTVDASGSGAGGDIDLDAAASVIISGTLVTDGGSASGGTGGSVELTACSVRVDSAGHVSSLRPAGSNLLIGHDTTVVSGTVRAGAQNTIRFAGPAYGPSILPGAQIVPGATLIEDSSIVPCNPFDTPTPTVTDTPTSEVTPPPTPTSTPVPPDGCVGDCDGSGAVTVSDIITGVNIVLGNQPVSSCPSFDADGGGTVTIGEIIQGVNNLLNGCPS